ncbi:MAG: PEGA domain protein [Methanoregulaceae archaeon PtaB.Bin009]|nr:MAG: PEGA domain protein [Methanoregulaceae archaeon PtaB.Bin009]OPY38813.1 MAG: PEGA domain protein [Methanoregulaceae archaeon PtaU1.Bin066]
MRMNTHVLIFLFFLSAMAGILPVNGSQPVAGDAGYFLIESDPSGAQVIFDNRFIGVTPVTYPIMGTSSPPHTITIAASGYYPHTTQYMVNPQPGETIRAYADLEPSQSFGTLVITSTPGGALVTVDGGKGQQAPWTYQDIRAGSHLVQAFLSGYEPYVTITDVPAGGSITIDAVLKPLSDVGTIQVKSTPGGADVYVDGIFRGSTATTVGNLAAGSHFVLLKMVGYQDWSGIVTVRPNQVTILDISLQVQTGMKTGFIHIESTPSGASVFVDGVYQGVTQAGNPLDLTGIAPGEHVLTLKLENYQDYTTRVLVQAGKTASVRATLTPVQAPAGSGVVQITSEPSGANIFIDNRCVGITPLTIPSIPAGIHEIVIRLDGYQDYKNTFNISPGQTAQIQVALTSQIPGIPLPVSSCILALCAAGIIFTFRRWQEK